MRPLIAQLFLLATVAQAHGEKIKSLKITVLSTMLADSGVGEWGFAALVEADGKRWLFDTGARPDTVLTNAKELDIDLSTITDVILSHNHGDHTGGLLTLRRELKKKNPAALSRAHVGKGAFGPRAVNKLLSDRPAYQESGAAYVEHDKPAQLAPGVWLTGPVPRIHPERNHPHDDTIPEDQSLVFDTAQGLVVLSGCGHSGIINTVEYAKKIAGAAPLHAAIGGFHLFALDEAKLGWTLGKLREHGIAHFLGAHCTGLEPVYRLRSEARLPRQQCAVGAVGSSFTLGRGIDPLRLAR
jgi:7,8-dihydropterin-6-yl-methyl-4-(beta-D-ribofuranosyl)aminobenzene 5'-phosphate synthase